MEQYILSTPRLHLREWIDSDIEPFAEMNADPLVMKYFPKTLSYEETVQSVDRIKLHFEKAGFGLFAIEEKGTKQFIGFTGFAIPGFESFFTPCIEIGWRLRKEFWGLGLATEAALACLSYGFNALKLETVYSFTSTINTPSENVMKRIGMQYVTTFNHPNLETHHILCSHVLYKITRPAIPSPL